MLISVFYLFGASYEALGGKVDGEGAGDNICLFHDGSIFDGFLAISNEEPFIVCRLATREVEGEG